MGDVDAIHPGYGFLRRTGISRRFATAARSNSSARPRSPCMRCDKNSPAPSRAAPCFRYAGERRRGRDVRGDAEGGRRWFPRHDQGSRGARPGDAASHNEASLLRCFTPPGRKRRRLLDTAKLSGEADHEPAPHRVPNRRGYARKTVHLGERLFHSRRNQKVIENVRHRS